MRFSIAIVAAFAGIVSAATTTTTAAVSTASCAAQNIVEACLGSTQPILDSCTPNDWKCMCAAQESVSTCYDNCPGDTLRVTANQKKDVYCQAAKAYVPELFNPKFLSSCYHSSKRVT
ncbi:hypothetical protein EJ08DRAFT_170518 [Tothia fuscella]|uniref:Extracellular membrane protein CFEM domain-containing protein n=1 Tax=Tothia fuscella TaxID=1048955 RepID=A0A9P4NTL4_9PEZI|nr:hypothetical protein EJ08DRAFT_170518 [Tothia fuscella]